ncbi:MAG TPA: acyltransferase [Sphingomicrobium sp.]|nr:acyltransferase [Sphingomicrobium sp.]
MLRGVAAFSVMLLHSSPPAAAVPIPHAYLAVDLFFVLSGFVLAYAYQERLGTAGQLGQFCIARLIRLYPLYWAAVVMTAGLMLFFSFIGANGTLPPRPIIGSLVPALALLPVPPSWSTRPELVFPLVVTSWSLFWELLVNVLYGAIAPKLRWWLLAAVIALGAFGLALALHSQGSLDLGWRWQGVWGGAPRAIFSFFAGVAIFRLRKVRRAPGIPSWILAAVLLLSFLPAVRAPAYDGFCVVLLYPSIVWFAADAAEGSRMRSAGLFAGFLSYPIYLMQVPVQIAIAPFAVRLARIAPSAGILELLLYVGGTLLVSWAIARWFDSPVREALRRRFAARAPRPAAQSAP